MAEKKENKTIEAKEEKIEEEAEEIKEDIAEVEEKIEEIEEKEEHYEEDAEELKEDLKKEEKKIKKIKDKFDKEESSDEEEVIDLKKTFSGFLGVFKGKGESKEKEHRAKEKEKASKEAIEISPDAIKNFFKKYHVFLLMLIPVIICIYLRAQPIDMPVIDQWAESTVYNNVQMSIAQDINQRYPNLPDAEKNKIIEQQFTQVMKDSAQKKMIDQQIEATANYFRSNIQDESGQTYLGDIDTWLWYGYANRYLKYGFFGNEVVNGVEMDTLRNGRIGQPAMNFVVISYAEVILYKIFSIFKDVSTMTSAFYISLILMTLAIIPSFLLGRRIGGNLGGIVAGIIVASNTTLLGRTVASVADTDALTVLFPILIAWLFFEAFTSKKEKNVTLLAILAGISQTFFFLSWYGWWYIFDFAIVTVILYIAYYTLSDWKKVKEGISPFNMPPVKRALKVLLVYVLTSCVLSIITSALLLNQSLIESAIRVVTEPLSLALDFVYLKQVAVTTIWPNVLTTVAELNALDISQIIGVVGGKLLLFLAIVGIVLCFIKKEEGERRYVIYGIFIAVWIIATVYASNKSVRFVALLAPGFAFALGAGIGLIYAYTSEWLTKAYNMNAIAVKIVTAILLLLLLVNPLQAAVGTAKSEVTMMTDAWYDSLTGIRDNTTDAIITSWWDFGHWFTAIAERRVTFDGGDQGNRIHWVGRALQTDSEDEAMAILRMLNCGQEEGFNTIEKYMDNDSFRAVTVTKKIIMLNKEEAKKALEKEGLSQDQIRDVLNLTHCDNLIDQFFIASDDMVGKAGVWSHFGSWNFTRGSMYNDVKGTSPASGVSILKETYALSDEEANNYYYEIKNNDADYWVTGWYNYLSGLQSCVIAVNNKTKNTEIVCGQLRFDAVTKEAVIEANGQKLHPNSVVYADKYGTHEKKYTNSTTGYSICIIPQGAGYASLAVMPELAHSMFTRMYFYRGHGLHHFKPFSYKQSFMSQQIFVYSIDWSGKEMYLIDEFDEPKEEVKEASSEEDGEDMGSNSSI